MSSLAHTGWLTQALQLIPARLHAALDGWSHKVALERAARRRQLARPAASLPATNFAEYKLRPWRD
jgi:hypothetical protein